MRAEIDARKVGVSQVISGVVFILAILPPLSQADLTLEQNVEGGPHSGQIVMRVKGDRFRLDLPGGSTGPVSTIMNVKTGETTTLFHQRKVSIKRAGEKSKRSQETPTAPPEVAPPKPAATGIVERVGDYDAEIHILSDAESKETLWVAKSFPHFNSITEDLRRVSKASTGGINRAGTLDLTALPGMVVKREKQRGGQKMTITLTGVQQGPLEDSVFEIPAGYKPVAPPPSPSRN